MLIRINQQENVDTYANFDSATGGLGGRVRPQDIFVINTRFEKLHARPGHCSSRPTFALRSPATGSSPSTG